MAAVLIRLLTSAATTSGADIEIVRDGQPKAVIVIADQPDTIAIISGMLTDTNRTVRFAAEELQRYVERVTGAKLPITTTSAVPAGKPLILVGRSAEARHRGVTPAGLESEGFTIRTDADSVAIVGEIAPAGAWQGGLDRGTLWGVYEFLERVAGVHWYFAGDLWTHIPQRKTLTVPPTTMIRAPACQLRVGAIGDTYGGNKMAWLPAVRSLNATGFNANHTCVLWGQLYGKTHPEYFALLPDGSRMITNAITGRSNHLCYTEPGVLQQDLANVESCDKTGRGLYGDSSLNPTKWYVRFSANDLENIYHCVCPRCRAQWRRGDPMGLHSELMFGYADRFAREISRRWPGRRLGTLAYMSYQRAPRTFALADNLDVMYCMVHSTTLLKEKEIYERELAKMREWWETLGRERRRFYVWDYFVYPNSFAAAPMLSPHVTQRFFRENQPFIQGAFNNGFSEKNGRPCHLTYLMTWLWHKILWDPGVNVDRLLGEFYADMFGPAEEPMRKFFTLEINRWEKTQWTHTAPGYGFGVSLQQIYSETYPRPVVEEMEALLARAKSAAPADSIHAKRVEWWTDAHADFFAEARKVQKWTKPPPQVRLPVVEPISLVGWRLGDPPAAATRVWLGRDATGLRIKAELDGTTGGQDDLFGVQIDAGSDWPYGLPSFYEITINPKGTISDERVVEPVFVDGYHHRGRFPEWNADGAQARTEIGAGGWQAELTLPFRAIPEWKGSPPKMVRMQLIRRNRAKPSEDLIWWPTLADNYEHPLDRFPVVWLDR